MERNIDWFELKIGQIIYSEYLGIKNQQLVNEDNYRILYTLQDEGWTFTDERNDIFVPNTGKRYAKPDAIKTPFEVIKETVNKYSGIMGPNSFAQLMQQVHEWSGEQVFKINDH